MRGAIQRKLGAQTQGGANGSFTNDGTAGPTLARGGQALPASAAPVTAGSVFTDEMLGGLPGKASAGLNAALQRGIAALPGESPWEGKSISDLYAENRGSYNEARKDYATENPKMNTAATVGGSVFGMGKLGGASTTRLVNQSWPTLGRFLGMTAGTAADGALWGAANAYGHDQDVTQGALTGGVLGGLSYPAMQGLTTGARSIGGMLGIGNKGRAQGVMAELMRRAGLSADDVGDDLARAAQDGQSVYTVADALGNPGQRTLSGIARTPGDARTQIVEALESRQSGQGRRIANALSEGFDATDTAAQRAAALTAQRNAQAAQNYGAARTSSGAVDPSAAIKAADDFLTPGASGLFNPGSNIADDSIEAAVRRARNYLTDGKSVLSDFNSAFRSKRELDAMIEGAKPAVQSQLIPIRNALDNALEAASPAYANARNLYRQQSKAIEAIETGRNAAIRGRVEDTIPNFNSMTPQEQAAFRAGYADPLITQTQGAATGANKARPLINDATAAEFPVFAAPGRGEQLTNRIARENRMFETRAQALGGSKTADNLADMAEAGSFDPSMVADIAAGRWGRLAGRAVKGSANMLSGQNQQVRNQVATMLLTNSPTQAKIELARAVTRGDKLSKAQMTALHGFLGASIPALNGLIQDR